MYEASRVGIDLEVAKFNAEIDSWNKKIIGESYECISKCYKQDKSPQEIEECSQKCGKQVAKQQKFIENRLKSYANRYDDCTRSCHNLHGQKLSPILEHCIQKCTVLVSIQIKTLKKNTIILIKDYLNKQKNN